MSVGLALIVGGIALAVFVSYSLGALLIVLGVILLVLGR